MEDGRSVQTVDLATDRLSGQPGNPAPPYFWNSTAGTRWPQADSLSAIRYPLSARTRIGKVASQASNLMLPGVDPNTIT